MSPEEQPHEPKPEPGVPEWLKEIVNHHNFVNSLSPELRNLWDWLEAYEKNPY